ncbi:unnamed protein product [Amoebophrya sp. A120]|nr:unnamed protein product [Amoebophrya sp. A120]|eukprot:GSA120T00006792001.1
MENFFAAEQTPIPCRLCPTASGFIFFYVTAATIAVETFLWHLRRSRKSHASLQFKQEHHQKSVRLFAGLTRDQIKQDKVARGENDSTGKRSKSLDGSPESPETASLLVAAVGVGRGNVNEELTGRREDERINCQPQQAAGIGAGASLLKTNRASAAVSAEEINSSQVQVIFQTGKKLDLSGVVLFYQWVGYLLLCSLFLLFLFLPKLYPTARAGPSIFRSFIECHFFAQSGSASSGRATSFIGGFLDATGAGAFPLPQAQLDAPSIGRSGNFLRDRLLLLHPVSLLLPGGGGEEYQHADAAAGEGAAAAGSWPSTGGVDVPVVHERIQRHLLRGTAAVDRAPKDVPLSNVKMSGSGRMQDLWCRFSMPHEVSMRDPA